MATIGLSHTPLENHPLAARREPPALEGWMRSDRKQGFSADSFHGGVGCSPMLGAFKTLKDLNGTMQD